MCTLYCRVVCTPRRSVVFFFFCSFHFFSFSLLLFIVIIFRRLGKNIHDRDSRGSRPSRNTVRFARPFPGVRDVTTCDRYANKTHGVRATTTRRPRPIRPATDGRPPARDRRLHGDLASYAHTTYMGYGKNIQKPRRSSRLPPTWVSQVNTLGRL